MKKQSVWMAILKSIGYALLFIGAQIFAQLLAEGVIFGSLLLGGMDYEGVASVIETVYSGLIYEITFLSAFIFLGFMFLMQRNRFIPQNNIRKTSWVSVGAAVFLGFAAYIGVSYLIGIANQIPAVQQSQESYMEQHENIQQAATNGWMEFLYVVFMAPVVEELLCRGSILNTLKRSFSPLPAIVISGALFALIHGNLYQVIFTLPLGILLGYLAHRFQSLWPSVALHMAFNGTNYLVRLGTSLGFGEESPWTYFFMYATLLLCLVSVPIGILMLNRAKEVQPAPVLLRPAQPVEPRPPYAPPAQRPFAPPMQQMQRPMQPPAPPMQPPVTPAPQPVIQKGVPMAAPEFIIVGLGNPGEKYASNRHNCGFMALDYIALRQNATIQNLRFRALTGETVIEGKKVLLMKPQTFMNSSGEAVREAAAYYKIPVENVLVIFDDISFAPGIFRIRKSGSAGGHNGIKSIISCLSSDAFPRIKMGVGTPPQGYELMNWVLGNLPREDLDHVIASMEDVYSTAKAFVKGELDGASASFNGKSH